MKTARAWALERHDASSEGVTLEEYYERIQHDAYVAGLLKAAKVCRHENTINSELHAKAIEAEVKKEGK